jgi:hypothetical protein
MPFAAVAATIGYVGGAYTRAPKGFARGANRLILRPDPSFASFLLCARIDRPLTAFARD